MMKMNLQLFAHKKGVGSTKNGRDSESKRLGAKRADGQFVKAGNILYMEIVEEPAHRWFVGAQFHPEFKSRPDRPHPLFRGFVQASLETAE